MSSLTVLCPNAHRVKVSTNPNMSLQAVLETACAKKGFIATNHVLEFHRKRLDLSNSIRFSGLHAFIFIFYPHLVYSYFARNSQQCDRGDV